MRDQSRNAGGLFLMLSILGGAWWGLGHGQAMLGILSGTGIGIVLATIIWLVDRARSGTRR